MLIPHPDDYRHKTHMLNLLQAVLADNTLSNALMFKGGTCASLRGLLLRFSVDLDFDITTTNPQIQQDLKLRLHKIFKAQGLRVDQESAHHLQFFLKYSAPDKARSTLKLEINDHPSPQNDYETITLEELNLVCHAQTIPTMFANKLVAALNRFDQRNHPAGRDFYDIREFFLTGLPIKKEIIEDRMGISYPQYLARLLDFVTTQLTVSMLYQDLNMLLPSHNFKNAVNKIIPDLKVFISTELARAKAK